MNPFVELVYNLNKESSNFSPEQILEKSLNEFSDKITYICSFGSESAIILNMISKINKNFPIFLLNSNFLFPETIDYKNDLIDRLKLVNCKDIYPDKVSLKKNDPNNNLWEKNIDKCCNLRKVIPLELKLKEFNAWISGRKSYHQGERSELKAFEFLNGKVVVNPLVNLNKNEVDEYFEKNDLPKHPLVKEGFMSIGCIQCTSKTVDPNNIRSGRWKNSVKTECGIHLSKKN